MITEADEMNGYTSVKDFSDYPNPSIWMIDETLGMELRIENERYSAKLRNQDRAQDKKWGKDGENFQKLNICWK